MFMFDSVLTYFVISFASYLKIQNMSKRAGNINYHQKTLLIEFVKKNTKLIEGKFDKDFTYKNGQQLWKDITKILNQVPNGGFKNWRQWRKVWQDLKTKTKKTIINRNICQTGSDALYEEILNDVDSAIIDVVSNTSIDGIKNINETVVAVYDDTSIDENDSKMPSTSFFFSDAELGESASPAEDPLDISTSTSPSHVQEHENSESEAIDEDNKVHMNTTIKQKVSKRQTLEKTLNATENMTRLYKQKMEIKENYYKKKLQLMEEDIKTKKEILQNLKVITDILSNK